MQDLEETLVEVETGAAGKEIDDVTAEQDGVSRTTLPTTADAPVQQTGDDDVNLFEEEKRLSLVDRDEEGVEQGLDNQHPPQDESASAALSSAQAEATSSLFLRPRVLPKKYGKRNKPAFKRDPSKPVIIILDSLGGPHSNATRALREWLQMEGLQRRGLDVEMDNKGYYAKASQVPMQPNLDDCGLYVLGYVQQFFKNPDEFKDRLLTGMMSAAEDWPDMHPPRMRKKIRELIFKLHADQKEALKAKKAAKSRVSPSLSAKAGSQRTSPDAQQSAGVETGTAIVQAGAEKLSPGTADVEPTPHVGMARRLGSPFEHEVRKEVIARGTVEGGAKDDGSKSHPNLVIFAESPETTSALPKNTPPRRRGSPEVRVFTSPHIDRSEYVRQGGDVYQSHDSAQQPTDLTSPLRKETLPNRDGKPREQLKKPPATSTSRPTREQATSSSPLHSRTRSGSHSDPITLDDSQDLDLALPKPKSPTQANHPSPELIELDHPHDVLTVPVRRAKPTYKSTNRTSPTQRTHTQTLPRSNSVQDGLRNEWVDGRDGSRESRVPLIDESHVSHSADARGVLRGWYVGPAGAVRGGDGDGQPMDVDAQPINVGGDVQPMDVDGDRDGDVDTDTQPMDLDTEIRETPDVELESIVRRSPVNGYFGGAW